MKTKQEQKKQIQSLIRNIDSRITDLMTLKGGWIMSNKMFRLILKEHPQLSNELDILNNRKFNLERKLWKL